MKALVCAILSLCLCLTTVQAQDDKMHTDILFLLDGSNSMRGNWDNQTKFEVASELLVELMDQYYATDPTVSMGVRVFGQQSFMDAYNCEDSELMVPFAQRNTSIIRNRLAQVRPKGWSPIAYSLEEAAKDFPRYYNQRKVLIFISDGGETCNGDPCQVAETMMKYDVQLQPHVVGLGDNPYLIEEIGCIGTFAQAEDKAAFKAVLDDIMEQTFGSNEAPIIARDTIADMEMKAVNVVENTAIKSEQNLQGVQAIAAQSNIDTIAFDEALATSDNIEAEALPLKNAKVHQLALYDHRSKLTSNYHYTFAMNGLRNQQRTAVHALDGKQLKDELPVKYAGLYNITVHTTPAIERSRMQLLPESPKTIEVKVKTGFLKIRTKGSDRYEADYSALLQHTDKGDIFAQQGLNTKQAYIADRYDIELSSTPPLRFDNVEVLPGDTTIISVPNPGMFKLQAQQAIDGTLFKVEGKQLIAVRHFYAHSGKISVPILPGAYQFIYRKKHAQSAESTVARLFKIISGNQYTLNIEAL